MTPDEALVYKKVAEVIAAGLATLAIAGVGIGMGRVAGSLVEAIGRNPAAADKLKGIGLIGMAFTEALALFCLLIVILILNQ